MFAEEINDSGGVTIGEEQRTLELVVADNAGTADGATAAAESLIDDDDVLVMVGPNASVAAVPAGGVANERETPMISPWSTNAARRWGGRGCSALRTSTCSRGRSWPRSQPRSSERSERACSSRPTAMPRAA